MSQTCSAVVLPAASKPSSAMPTVSRCLGPRRGAASAGPLPHLHPRSVLPFFVSGALPSCPVAARPGRVCRCARGLHTAPEVGPRCVLIARWAQSVSSRLATEPEPEVVHTTRVKDLGGGGDDGDGSPPSPASSIGWIPTISQAGGCTRTSRRRWLSGKRPSNAAWRACLAASRSHVRGCPPSLG